MTNTYAIELVPAILTPFEWSVAGRNSLLGLPVPTTSGSNDNSGLTAEQQAQAGYMSAIDTRPGANANRTVDIGYFSNSTTTNTPSAVSFPLQGNPIWPLYQTGGMVFPYNPTISESLATKYEVVELIHANENIHTFKNTDNARITLSECVWTAETFDQAIYTLGVIHFLRSYRLMDFGRGRSGRPPSPMWFSAYGAYAYNAIPVLIERADFTFPADIDYVGVPNPGTDAYSNQLLNFSSNIPDLNTASYNSSGDFTWIPIKFTVSSISMVVQHSIQYWTQFNLDTFKAGGLTDIRR